jgi:hypothetical protein
MHRKPADHDLAHLLGLLDPAYMERFAVKVMPHFG